MESTTDFSAQSNPGEQPGPVTLEDAVTIDYPPKPELEESKSRTNVWLRSLSSLALYFVIGYFFFNRDWLLVLVLTGVVVFHELGHFFAMKWYNYKDLGIFFIPLLGAYASGTKREISQTQSAIIILAGPVPGILAGIIVYFFAINGDNLFLEKMSWILIFLNLLNLFPIYPLDGGQLLNRLFLDESAIIGKIFIVLSALALGWFFWNIEFYPLWNIKFNPLLIFPIMMLVRFFSDMRHDRLIKKVESEGIDLNTSYEEISNENYWKIREAVIKHDPELAGIRQAPPYEYSEQEEKIVATVQGMLQRIIILDLSLAGKLFILLIWLGCFAAPAIIGMPLRLFY